MSKFQANLNLPLATKVFLMRWEILSHLLRLLAAPRLAAFVALCKKWQLNAKIASGPDRIRSEKNWSRLGLNWEVFGLLQDIPSASPAVLIS